MGNGRLDIVPGTPHRGGHTFGVNTSCHLYWNPATKQRYGDFFCKIKLFDRLVTIYTLQFRVFRIYDNVAYNF
jgi:hypothetical protein